LNGLIYLWRLVGAFTSHDISRGMAFPSRWKSQGMHSLFDMLLASQFPLELARIVKTHSLGAVIETELKSELWMNLKVLYSPIFELGSEVSFEYLTLSINRQSP
jgi:hypothetical protein